MGGRFAPLVAFATANLACNTVSKIVGVEGRSLRSLGGFATANLACNTVSKIVGVEGRSLRSLGGFRHREPRLRIIIDNEFVFISENTKA